jgi:hypothetical protein
MYSTVLSFLLMRLTDSFTTAAGFDTLRHLIGLVRRLTALPTHSEVPTQSGLAHWRLERSPTHVASAAFP